MTVKTRMCCRCSQEKPISEFYDGRGYCKKCRREYQREWREKNPEKARAWSKRNPSKRKAINDKYKEINREAIRVSDRRYQLERVYGMTLEEYDDLLIRQDGSCAGCEATEYNDRSYHLAVDHNHETGEMRGLLCLRCNRILGLANDDPVMLRRLAEYLENARGEEHKTPGGAVLYEA